MAQAIIAVTLVSTIPLVSRLKLPQARANSSAYGVKLQLQRPTAP